jgi:4-amino-4-deoxy-L-arabinose transferase-like glycosyltransferase
LRWWLTAAFATYFAALTLFFFFAAEINADEGFYLIASRLVYEGKLPYRDFHYTQMPLLPYIYGLPQLVLGESLYVGRLTSVALLVAAFLVTVKVARRLAGTGSAIWIALLLGTNWWFIYLGTITKTHPLVYLLIALSVYVCAKEIDAPSEDARKRALLLILGTVLVGAAVLVRLPALGFAAVLFGYTSFRAAQIGRRWLALNVLAAAAVGGVAAAFALAVGWDVFWFNTVGFHWVSSGTIEAGTGALRPVVWALNAGSRLRDLQGTYGSVFPIELLVLGFAVVVQTWRVQWRSGTPVEKHQSQLMLAVALGTFALAVSPIFRDASQPDYAVISFPCAALVIAFAYDRMARLGLDRAAVGRWLLAVLVFVSAYHVLRYAFPPVGPLGVMRVNGDVKLPLNYVREVASLLKQHRKADGTMLTMYAFLAYEAELPLVTGLEMQEVACQELPTSETRRYKIVNIESVVTMIASARAEYVIVSKYRDPFDFSNCRWTKDTRNATRRHLEQHYHALAEFDDFGEQKEAIVVYQRKGRG